MDDDVQQYERHPLQNQDRDRFDYDLIVRQEPKQARMCGVGNDRRPIDPPPIVQLRVIDRGATDSVPSRSSSPDSGGNQYVSSYLQNPYYFMYASLAQPDEDVEIHWFNGGKTRCTAGSVVSSLYHLKDSENRGEDAAFFVFPDLSVRMEGSYRLKLSLFEVVGTSVRYCKSVYSAPFYVYTAKKFPGMEESTQLSCTMADQGIKIRIRKDIRTRRRTLVPAPPQPIGPSETSPTLGHASQKAEDEPKEKKGRGIRIVRDIKRQKIEKIGEIVPDDRDNTTEPGTSHLVPPWPGTTPAPAPAPAPTPTVQPTPPETTPPAQNQQPQPQQQVSPTSPTQPPSDHTQYDHRSNYSYDHTAPQQQAPPAHHYQPGPPTAYGPPPPHYQYGNYGPPPSSWSQPSGYDHYQPPPLHYAPPQPQQNHHQHPPAPAPAPAPAPVPGALPPPSHHPSHGHPPPPAPYRPPPADYSYPPPSNAQTYNSYEHHYTYPPPPMPSQHSYPQQGGYNGPGLPPPQPAPAQGHPSQDVRASQPVQTRAGTHYPQPAPGYSHTTPPAPHSYELPPPPQHHQSQAQHHPQPHHQPQPHQQPQPQPQAQHHQAQQQYRHYPPPPPAAGYAQYNPNPGEAWGVPNSGGYGGHGQGGSGGLPLPPPTTGYQQHPHQAHQAHDGSMGGPGMRGGDRIQLAPLRATQDSPPPPGPPSAISVHSNGSGGDGTPGGRGQHVEGRRNPLSIGNIIDGSR